LHYHVYTHCWNKHNRSNKK